MRQRMFYSGSGSAAPVAESGICVERAPLVHAHLPNRELKSGANPKPCGPFRLVINGVAVPVCSTVWVNGIVAAWHEGGAFLASASKP